MRDAPDTDLLRKDGAHIGLEVVRMADERQLTLRQRFERGDRRIQSGLPAPSPGCLRELPTSRRCSAIPTRRLGIEKVPKAIVFFTVKRGRA
ncbi:MAG: hypothetical protein IPH80_28250 [Myxococcales bacterium]|nr:hypothetical protein [Myxococcales bacterium]